VAFKRTFARRTILGETEGEEPSASALASRITTAASSDGSFTTGGARRAGNLEGLGVLTCTGATAANGSATMQGSLDDW